MGQYLLDQVHDVPVSIFLGFWATLTNALFAFIGTELIGVCDFSFALSLIVTHNDFQVTVGEVMDIILAVLPVVLTFLTG